MSLPVLRQPFWLLNSRTGWQPAATDGVEVGDCIELAAVPGSSRPLVDSAGSFGGFALPTGVAVDSDGAIYVLDGADAVVKRFDPCAGAFVTLPCFGGAGSGPRELCRPRGLGISPRGDLVIADTGNARVQVVALKGLVLRAIWGPPTPPGGSWQPTDVAVGLDCRVYVSDPVQDAVHVFAPDGRALASFDVGGPATDIALDDRGRLYVVRRGFTDVLVLDSRTGAQVGVITAPDELAGRFCPLLVGADPDGTLHIVDTAGAIYRCGAGEIRACAVTAATPTAAGSTAAGSAAATPTALAFDPQGNLIVADAAGGVSVVSPSLRYEPSGTYITAALDSGIDQASWDAVALHGEIPAETSVQFDSYTTQTEPTPAQLAALPDSAWVGGATASGVAKGADWRALVLAPPGRYLAIRLRLAGGGASTPALYAVRAFYPRMSSIRHLPAVYREEPLSADFLDRFLSIFDATWTELATLLDDIPAYLDPHSAPAGTDYDFLSWLATWMGMTFERGWSAARRRAVLAASPTLYRLRGTVAGIRLQIRLFTGADAHVLEHFKLRRLLFLNASRLGVDSELWGPSFVGRLQLDEYASIGSFALRDDPDPLHDPFGYYANQFTVFFAARPDVDVAAVQRALASASPAHTVGTVVAVAPRMQLGTHSFIGLDTVVAAYPAGFVEGTGMLGQDTVLGRSCASVAPTLAVGQARVGTTTQID